jgi:hypothetical protein
MSNSSMTTMTCGNGTFWDETCTETCISLSACQLCPCSATISNVMDENDEEDMDMGSGGGPWGSVMDVLLCLGPILFLIIVTVKPHNPFPTTTSLPLAAIMMYLVRLMYLQSDPIQTHAAVLLGIHEAFTPLSIMGGAIALFESMECTYCLPYMMREMKALTQGHAVAELMLYVTFLPAIYHDDLSTTKTETKTKSLVLGCGCINSHTRVLLSPRIALFFWHFCWCLV